MKRLFKIEGIVIKRINLRETDKLVTIFTKYKGKLKVIARGVRRINSKRAPHLELFNHIQGYIARGRTFDTICEAQTIRSFPNLRINIVVCAFAYKMAELVDNLCPENQKNTSVFKLIIDALYKLDAGGEGKALSVTDSFTIGLLWDLGYLPKGKILKGVALGAFLKTVFERKLKTDSLLQKLSKSPEG